MMNALFVELDVLYLCPKMTKFSIEQLRKGCQTTFEGDACAAAQEAALMELLPPAPVSILSVCAVIAAQCCV